MNKRLLFVVVLVVVVVAFFVISRGTESAPTFAPAATATQVPSPTPEPDHWFSAMEPLEVLVASKLIPSGGSAKIAPHPTDSSKEYFFSAFGKYVTEEISGRVLAGELGEGEEYPAILNILIPEDLVGAFHTEGSVEILGEVWEIFGSDGSPMGNIQIALEVIRRPD